MQMNFDAMKKVAYSAKYVLVQRTLCYTSRQARNDAKEEKKRGPSTLYRQATTTTTASQPYFASFSNGEIQVYGDKRDIRDD